MIPFRSWIGFVVLIAAVGFGLAWLHGLIEALRFLGAL